MRTYCEVVRHAFYLIAFPLSIWFPENEGGVSFAGSTEGVGTDLMAVTTAVPYQWCCCVFFTVKNFFETYYSNEETFSESE